MENVEKIDNELYRAIYINSDIKEYTKQWEEIKKDPQILKQAIKIIRNKFDTEDTLLGITIADAILIDYKNVDKEIYQELINIIYSNIDIARTVIDGASNGGYSFLLMSLWNHDIKLTEVQKQFAVSEAMNKIGTTFWNNLEESYMKELEEKGITDDNTVLLNLSGSINPLGQKTASKYMNYLYSSMSKTQAHGVGAYDIRYCILRNPNWTVEEKQKLIYAFWYDKQDYEDTLEDLEWGIINDEANYQEGYNINLDKSELYNYTFDELVEIYGDKVIAKRIYEEINFLRQMHELRPASYEVDNKVKKKIK